MGPGTEVGQCSPSSPAEAYRCVGFSGDPISRQMHFAEQNKLQLTKEVDQAGGKFPRRARYDGRKPSPGVGDRPKRERAKMTLPMWGIDLCHGRHDDAAHYGRPPGHRHLRRTPTTSLA